MSKIKDFGIVYTPTEITYFLCVNTIFPYIINQVNHCFGSEFYFRDNGEIEPILSSMSRNQLDYLFEVVKNVRILDPAVGIGYFLLDSLYVLEELYKIFKEYQIMNWDANFVREWIITNNLYGVDISQESVERCKNNLTELLERKSSKNLLPRSVLSDRIKSGNTLIGCISEEDESFLTNFSCNSFHWVKEFPEIIKEGGFDIILSNPPWNILKPQEKEFFSKFDSRLTKYNVDKKEASIIINELQKKEEIGSKWKFYKNVIKKQSIFFKTKYKFQSDQMKINGKIKKISGDLNLYKLFVERIYELLKPNGYSGVVVPSGIHTDAGTKGLRRLLFESNQVCSIYSFENRKGIFPSIHKSFKFDLIIFTKRGKTKAFNAFFMQKNKNILRRVREKSVELNWELIKKLSPSSWSILEFKTNRDIEIAKKMYNHPIISKTSSDRRWKLHLMREFDVTLNSNLFNSKGKGFPIYEGKMIEQYTHLFKEPRYWINTEAINSKFGKEYSDYKEYRLGFRAIAASTNRRTMVATILPAKVCVGNSIIISRIFDSVNQNRLINEEDLLFLCGVFNSFVFDYLLRLKVTTNINMFYIYDMPVPNIRKGNKEYQGIIKNVVRLLSQETGLEPLRKVWLPNEIEKSKIYPIQIQAKIDFLVAKIYDINQHELEYILDQFHQRDSRKEAFLSELKKEILVQFHNLDS